MIMNLHKLLHGWNIVSEYDQEIPQLQTADNPIVQNFQNP